MYKSIFLAVLIFIGLALVSINSSNGGTDVQKYLPEDPSAVYVYSDVKGEHYTVVQNDGVSNGCINQHAISLSSEYPPTYVLNKNDVDAYLENMNSDKFYRSNNTICFKNQKIYNKHVQFFGENKWDFTLNKDSTFECNSSIQKSINIFQKKRDLIHTVCTDKKHNYTLQWSFVEGIGKYDSEGNSGPSTLLTIINSKQ